MVDKNKKRIKPGLGDLKNQVCDIANIPNENKTSHYLTRMQMEVYNNVV